jgi:HD-like signal output (HDOD) protein
MSQPVDIARIQKAVLNSIPFSFRLTTLPHESHAVVDRILEIFLQELGQEKLLEPLAYCLKELIINAQKANTKRVFFTEKGLDITREDDYEKGMKDFREETVTRMDEYLSKLQKYSLFIQVRFQTMAGRFMIMVRNNAAMTAKEQHRVYDRIVRARAFHSFSEALATSVDPTEGAGLGILILIQFLKRIGLGENAFSIASERGETRAAIQIPIADVHLHKLEILTEALIRDVESLPHFPDNVLEIIRATQDPEARIPEIAKKIGRDPALTADLLKLANSAFFMIPFRVNNILQAVKLVGLKGLRNLLYSYGTQRIMGEKYTEMKSLWENSYRTAFYAYILARSLKKRQEILDDVYVAGILHDLGLIVVNYMNADALAKMSAFCREKDIPLQTLEKFAFGLNHGEIGARIAERWNFPAQLVEGIRFHHEPLCARQQYKDIVFCVYMASALCGLEKGLIGFDEMETPVLHDFGIYSAAHCRKVLATLSRAFRDRQEMRR